MLTINHLTYHYERAPLLRDLSLSVERGEIVALLGASGSGKSTLLRLVAGLEQPDAGDIRFDGASVLGVPVHRRDFGLMFQDFALFPHLTVTQNVAFGLTMRRIAPAERIRRAADLLDLVGLSGYGARRVDSLSGGEQQRVALARSLAPQPRLLMLDEPMGALDAALRERLVADVRLVIRRVGVTALYVTHDQAEAYAIADRVAILHAGQIAQIDTPRALYARPQTEYVARFLGLDNIVAVLRHEQPDRVVTPLGTFSLPGTHAAAVLVHPAGLRLDVDGTLSGFVVTAAFAGETTRLTVETNGVTLSLVVAAPAAPQPGEHVRLALDPAALVPLDA